MAEELIVKVMGDASNLRGALDRAGGQVENFSVKIAKVGKIATIAGAAISAAFVKTFLDFTAYETRLVDMAKVTGESFEQIEEKIKSIDPILGSSTKLMEGYYQVISAGVKDPVKALETLTVASQAAKAAHTEQSEVVKGITKMMAGYEGAIKDAAEAADLLFAIEKEGQTTVAELIPVIGSLAKTSSDLNIKQTAMAASMAVISKTAGSTAEAATQYQAVLTGLMKPTDDMTAAMEDMGYKTAELAIAEEGLVEVLKHLEEYMYRTSTSAAELFGRKEAMLGFSALGAEGFRVLDETIVSVGEGMGGAERTFKEWSKTGAAAIDEIKSTFLNFSIMIGEKVAPIIRDLLKSVTAIITKIMEWADAHEPLFEWIVKVTATLGIMAAIGGPILLVTSAFLRARASIEAVITSLKLLQIRIIGVGTVSAGPIALFVVAVVAAYLACGKLTEYLRETVGGMREFRAELGLMELGAVNFEIQELIDTLEQLQKRFYEIPEGIGRQQILTMMDEINKRLEMLYERREELTKAEEAGIDVAKEKAKLDKEAAELLETLARATELANAQMEIENKLYALTHTAIEVQIKDLYELAMKWQTAGVSIDLVKEYVELATEAIYELNKEQEEHVSTMEEVAQVTKAVEDRWFALTHLPYEVKIKEINERYDEHIKVIKESNLSILAQETFIRNANLARDKEIEGVDKLTEAEKKNLKQKEKLEEAYETIEDKILELTETPMETMIRKLEEEADRMEDLGVEIELVNEWLRLQKEALKDTGDAFTEFGTIAWDALKKVTDYIVDNLTPAIENFFFGIEGYEGTWEDFWKGLWNVLKTYISNMIAKLIIAIPLMLIWNVITGGGLTWANFWLLWGKLGFEKGGGVGYDFIGQFEKFQFGGGTDTILARVTPGEYVIAKPMTDFIRRFRAFPQNLIDAIVRGIPTPAPAFAGGGLVGSPNITTTGYGETKIYVDIHDNRISDEIDIKRLAVTVSDRIVRKLNQRRRF